MISKKIKEMMKGSSAIRALFEEGKKLREIHGSENVYDFSLGNPSAPPPELINKAVKEFLDGYNPDLVHGYMNNSGYEDVRQKIAESTNREFNTNFSFKNVVMSCGAAGAINVVFKTILEPGDEVIVFAPCFSEYFNYINIFSGVPVIVDEYDENFSPNLALFEAKITAKTKAVIINSPNNPSGAIYSEETIKEIADILNKKQKEYGHAIYLISDEPYRKLIYSHVKVPYLTHYYNNTFVAYSFSKSLSLPGERIGYLTVPSEMEDFNDVMDGLNLCTRILGFVNAPSLFQHVAGACIDASVDMTIYSKNLDVLYNGLTQIGYECFKPQGAFYLLPKSPIADDVEFCSAAKKYNLLIVPGKGFRAPSHFRIAYCTDYNSCVNSLNAFEELFKDYNNK